MGGLGDKESDVEEDKCGEEVVIKGGGGWVNM